jgi:seryl-tRNA synthetase
MIDIQLIRDDITKVIKNLEKRNKDFSYLFEVKKQDEERREKITIVEKLKNERNVKSREIGILKREGKDINKLSEEVTIIGKEITKLDTQISVIEEFIKTKLLITPNLLDNSVPFGKDDEDNIEIEKHFEVPVFDFKIKDHAELGEYLNILDMPRASKITGARFAIYRGDGARLERALIQFMIDTHSKNKYIEIIPPYIVNKQSMTATGQLPKFEEDAFKLIGDNEWYLNPTAEVPTINMYRDEIIDYKALPLKFVSFTTAFRQEAGSAGRDMKGIFRNHQFNKVELIKITDNKTSALEHEKMLCDSKEILNLLKLPYRVVTLCSGDIGASMAKTYDIEVWIPSQNKYREIGSISNACDYQARRANMKYRNEDKKLEYCHTLNGSGLAVGRTWIAIVENYQQADGTVVIPDVLIPYFGKNIIKKN